MRLHAALWLALGLSLVCPNAGRTAAITPEQHDRETAEAAEQAASSLKQTSNVDITGLKLGQTRDEVVAILTAHSPTLVLQWRSISFEHVQLPQAFLAAETPRLAAERTLNDSLTDAKPLTATEDRDEEDSYLIAFSADTDKVIAIFRQYLPAANKPLVLDSTVKSVRVRYPFLIDNGLEGTGTGGNVMILGGPKQRMTYCSNQRSYMVPPDNFAEQRNYTIAGFDPQVTRDPSGFDDARATLMAARFNSTIPESPPPQDEKWVQENCGPVLAVSLAPRVDDPSLVRVLTMHLYDIRSIDKNLAAIADKMRQAEDSFLRANAANEPPL